MKHVETQNRLAGLELSDEDLGLASGSKGSETTVTCTGGTTAHIKTGTDANGNPFVTVKCY